MSPLVTGWSSKRPMNTVWQAHLAPSTKRAYNAEIEVWYTPLTGDEDVAPTFDPETGDYTYPEEHADEILYTGMARVQPVRTATEKVGTQIQPLLISVDQLDLDIRPKHMVRVIACAENTVLTAYKYVVTEVTDSSNLIERTFYVKQDAEVVPS